MLKNGHGCLCFKMSSSFVGNNPSLQPEARPNTVLGRAEPESATVVRPATRMALESEWHSGWRHFKVSYSVTVF